MLHLGTTRVELGVQTIYNDVYKRIKREHTVNDVVEATKAAKNAGLAVIYHMMPGLPGSTPNRDIKAFRTIFEDDRFKPDAIKIYPTLVLPNTPLYDQWKQRKYTPYDDDTMLDLLVNIKKLVPPWVRIQRIQRDIPSTMVAAGITRGDLRLLAQERLRAKGKNCNCIRCREVGHVQYKSNKEAHTEDIKLSVDRYHASEGEELFVTYEDVKQNMLIGLLRLRSPSQNAHKSEAENQRSLLVRELHVYGPTVQVGTKATDNQWQHRGWGEALMKEAERIACEEFDAHQIIVLAGIGTRNYYRRFGYERVGPYMIKKI
jgi:elongator complex protein 3